jgi:hypothetical protein
MLTFVVTFPITIWCIRSNTDKKNALAPNKVLDATLVLHELIYGVVVRFHMHGNDM